MARRVSRRKKPSREFHTIKEQNKIDTGIFDTKTMVYLSKFYNKGIIEKLHFVIARGKEADVYVADPGSSETVKNARFVTVKFFRVETSSFLKMHDYIKGDPRFSKMKLTKHNVVKAWCMKELGNLNIAASAGILSPKPYMANGSILAMEFIGDRNGTPSPQLKDVTLKEPAKFLNLIIKQARKLHESGLVHADLSEYNILVRNGRPHFIDFGQAVILKHPNAMLFLERDVKNLLAYFSKRYHIKRDASEVFGYVTH